MAEHQPAPYTMSVLTSYQQKTLEACQAMAQNDISPAERHFWLDQIEFYERARTELTLVLSDGYAELCKLAKK